MRSINKVIIIGNLTRDPVMKMTQSGQPVVTFGVATNRQWITRDNQRHNSAEFHEVVAWAKLADICEKYIHKGNLVYIEGYLKTRSWEGASEAEGKRYRTEIVVQDIVMLEKRRDGDSDSGEAFEQADRDVTAASNVFSVPSSDEPPIDELDVNLGLGEPISQESSF